jgi:protein STE50
MDATSVEPRSNILDWNESDVHNWLTTLGLPQYENQIHGACTVLTCRVRKWHRARTQAHTEHRVSGDVLCIMDADALKEVGVATIGQRLAILKAVYQLKVAQQIRFEADHYVPLCKWYLISICFYYLLFYSRDRGKATTAGCR